MKLFMSYFCIAIVVLFSGLVCAANEQNAAMVESIDFVGKRNGEEIIHFQLSGDIKPRVFELPGEKPRIVFDFIETGYPAKKKRAIRTGGKLVKKIRVGLHEQPVAKTRVVIDLASSKEFIVEKAFIPVTNILEVRISRKGEKDQQKPEVAILKNQVKNEKKKEEKNITAMAEKEPPADKQVETKTVIQEIQTKKVAASHEVVGKEKQQGVPEVIPAESLVTIGKDTHPEILGEAPMLINVSYEDTTNNKEMVLFKLNGFYPPVVFAIEEDEPRIVCDFLDAQLGENLKNVLNSGGKYINKVRVARHIDPKKVRVVIDLAAQNDYDLKQVFFKEDNLFVVIISSLGKK